MGAENSGIARQLRFAAPMFVGTHTLLDGPEEFTLDNNDKRRLTDYARTLIAVKAHELIGHYGLSQCDREDLEQQLILEVLEAAKDWDATRGSRNTYDNRIVNRKIVTIIRYRTRECRDYRRNTASLDGTARDEDGAPTSFGQTLREDEDRRRNGDDAATQRVDLAMDMHGAVSTLKPDLQRLCGLLSQGSAAEAARTLGVSKPTVFKRIRVIREQFAALGLDEYLPQRADGSDGRGVCDQ